MFTYWLNFFIYLFQTLLKMGRIIQSMKTHAINKSRKSKILIGIPTVLVITFLKNISHHVLLHTFLLLFHQTDFEAHISKKYLAFTLPLRLLRLRGWLECWSFSQTQLRVIEIQSWSYLLCRYVFEILLFWAYLTDLIIEIERTEWQYFLYDLNER